MRQFGKDEGEKRFNEYTALQLKMKFVGIKETKCF